MNEQFTHHPRHLRFPFRIPTHKVTHEKTRIFSFCYVFSVAALPNDDREHHIVAVHLDTGAVHRRRRSGAEYHRFDHHFCIGHRDVAAVHRRCQVVAVVVCELSHSVDSFFRSMTPQVAHRSRWNVYFLGAHLRHTQPASGKG